jgi:hypothetical protein
MSAAVDSTSLNRTPRIELPGRPARNETGKVGGKVADTSGAIEDEEDRR